MFFFLINTLLCTVILLLLPQSQIFIEPGRAIALFLVSTPDDVVTQWVQRLTNKRFAYRRARMVVREMQALVSFSVLAVMIVHVNVMHKEHGHELVALADLAYLVIIKLALARNLASSMNSVLDLPYTAVSGLLALATVYMPKVFQVMASCVIVEVLVCACAISKSAVLDKSEITRMMSLHLMSTAFWYAFGVVLDNEQWFAHTLAYYPLLFHELLNLYCIQVVV